MKFYAPLKSTAVGQKELFYKNGLINKISSRTIWVHDTYVADDWYALASVQQRLKVIDGSIKILVVKLDRFDNPSHYLKVEEHILSSDVNRKDTLNIPEGYAVNFKAIVPASKLEIYTSYSGDGTIPKKVTFDKDRWYFESFF